MKQSKRKQPTPAAADNLSARELQIMLAISRSPNCAKLDTIAARLGYRPARCGRIAVRSTLMRLLSMGKLPPDRYGESGTYVGRLPPQDRWDTESWFLTDHAKLFLQMRNDENAPYLFVAAK